MLNAFLVTGIMLLVVAHSAMLEPAPAARYTFDEDARDQKHPIKDVEPDARYTIEDKMIGDLHTKVLTNTLTGEYVQMVTDLGGRVEDLVLQGSDGKASQCSTHPSQQCYCYQGGRPVVEKCYITTICK